ncbi:MAG: P1 family peptidase [Coriobacteriales bacterium]|jgi:L-aminopeptidase/D-esterase-like protein|nr:P1 family peptidase [Coriobacteriales bacterium]
MSTEPSREYAFEQTLRPLLGSATPVPAGFFVGSVENDTAGTGCTVIGCPEGASAGVAVRGGAPATRETDLLAPENTVKAIHAVMVSGGSAYGLDAASGAVRWLEEHSAGFELAGHIVPIVCGASIFDLSLGDGSVRPDAAMGYAACEAGAEANERAIRCGNIGAGCGASVGKLFGEQSAMKAGLGAAGFELEGLIVSALVVVNALGNIYDRFAGTWIAGPRNPQDPQRIVDPYEALSIVSPYPSAGHNTTIACVITNAALEKPTMGRVASMAHDGFARAIEPVHTSADGDAIFALACGSISAPADIVGCFAALAVEHAIHVAIREAEAAYGLPANRDLR